MCKRRAATLIIAAVFALLHVGLVAVPLILSHGVGEQNGLGILLDLPLTLLWVVLSIVFHDRWGWGKEPTVLFISVGGTLMYAVIGAYLGSLVDTLRAFIRRRQAPRPPG